MTHSIELNSPFTIRPAVLLGILAIGSLCIVSKPCRAAKIRADVLASSGEYSTTLDGVFTGFTPPAISDSGIVAFNATIDATPPGPFPFPDPTLITTRILRWNSNDFTEIAATGAAAPDGNGNFVSFTDPSVNDAGDVAFRADLDIFFAGRNDEGVYRGDGQVLTQVARGNQSPSDSSGTFRAFSFDNLNANGDIAFYGYLVASSTNFGLFHGDGSLVETIFRPGWPSPDGNGKISSAAASLAFNSAGSYAFFVSFTDTLGGTDDDRGIVMGTSSSLAIVAREGTAVPGGDGEFLQFFNPSLNDSGTMAFPAQLKDTSNGTSNDSALFRYEQDSLIELVREGQSVPDENGSFSVFTVPAINDAGQVAFGADLRNTSHGALDSEGVYLIDGPSIIELARAGMVVADGESFLESFDDIALNNAGQVSFLASVTNSVTGDYEGIYVADASDGPVELARTGGELLGSSIVSLSLRGALGTRDSNESGLSDDGTVAFYFELEDGRSGIALARVVPEPPAVWVLLTCCGVVLLLRSRLKSRHRIPNAA